MSYARAIALNTLLMIGGRIVTTILSLIVTAALARSLGVFGYGEFTTAFVFMTFFGVFADFGFFQIFVRELVRRPKDQVAIAGNILALRMLFGVVVYGFAASCVWLFPYSLAVKQAVVILALASFFLSVNTTLVAVFQARQTMFKAVIGDVIGRVVLLALVMLVLRAQGSLQSIFFVYVAANFVNLFITSRLVLKEIPLRFQMQPGIWKTMVREAWPLGVVTMLGALYFKIDTVILSVVKSPIDVGIYGAPYKIFELLTIVPAFFMGNVFPTLTQLLATNRERANRLIQAAFDSLMIAGLGIAAILIGGATGIVRLTVGEEFVHASTVAVAGHPITAVSILALLSLALICTFLGALWSHVVIALGYQRALIWPGVIAVIINLALNLALIPRLSYFAATVTTILTELFIAVSWGFVTYHYLPFRLKLKPTLLALVAAILTYFAIVLMHDLPILISLSLGVCVYIGALWLLGGIPLELVRQLKISPKKTMGEEA